MTDEAAMVEDQGDLAGLRRLHELYAKLASEADLDTALADILAAAVELTGTDRGVVQRVSKDGERLEFAAHQGYGEGTRFTEHFRQQGSKAACDVARAHRQRMIIEDVATFPGLAGTIDREIALAEDIRATLSIPMVSRTGELIGVLNTQFRKPHRPSDRELRLMDMLAWTAAGFIERHDAGEAALRTSEDRYRTLFESIDEGFYFARALFDSDGRCTDIAYDDENPAAIRMIGRPAKGRRLSELGDYEDYWLEVFGTVARTGEARRLEHYAAPDGIWYDFYVFKPPQADADEFAVVFRDVTARRSAEEAVRRSEERQAFLLKLSDALRPLGDPAAIRTEACRLLGEQVGADWVVYGQIDVARDIVDIDRGYAREGEPPITGEQPLSAFGWTLESYQAGRTIVVSDTQTSERVPAGDRAAMAGIQMTALIAVPLLKNGELVGALALSQREPRAWTEAEVRLVEETAERIWDAIERARAEAALRASEERIRSALEIETVAVLFWGSDFRLRQCNSAFLAMTGFSHEEAVGLTWQELTPPEFHPASEWAVAQIETTGRADPYEKQYYRKDGSRWWGLFAPRRLADGDVVEFVLDVSDRRRKEKALRESEEQLRLIVESARDYAIFTTDPDGLIRGWYAGAENVFVWSAAEAVGASVNMTFTPEDREKGEPEKERITARDDGRAPNVRWHVRKDGSRVFIEGFAVPLRSEAGELTGFLKIGQDVTARMQAQEHERMLLFELQHRVRNTLAVVRSIVARTASASATVEEMEAHLSGRLAAFSRVQATVTRNPGAGVDLNALVQDELLAHATREGPRLRINGSEVLLQPKAAEGFSLAIHELTTNAVKYGALAGDSGRLEVGWSVQGEPGAEELHFTWVERDLALGSGGGHEGFGTELLLRSLPYEIDAETSLEFAKTGVRFKMSVPADRALSAAKGAQL
ncbi:MAG TPA: PAS domain S-box protein [Allosphingosinicella sp.]|jgi:PAS domain S-box-containing protein